MYKETATLDLKIAGEKALKNIIDMLKKADEDLDKEHKYKVSADGKSLDEILKKFENIVKIEQSIEKDKDGKLFSSYKLIDENGSKILIDQEGDLKRVLDKVMDLDATYKKLNKSIEEYYSLLSKIDSGDKSKTTELKRNQAKENIDNLKDEISLMEKKGFASNELKRKTEALEKALEKDLIAKRNSIKQNGDKNKEISDIDNLNTSYKNLIKSIEKVYSLKTKIAKGDTSESTAHDLENAKLDLKDKRNKYRNAKRRKNISSDMYSDYDIEIKSLTKAKEKDLSDLKKSIISEEKKNAVKKQAEETKKANEELISTYKKLNTELKEYYSLLSKIDSGDKSKTTELKKNQAKENIQTLRKRINNYKRKGIENKDEAIYSKELEDALKNDNSQKVKELETKAFNSDLDKAKKTYSEIYELKQKIGNIDDGLLKDEYNGKLSSLEIDYNKAIKELDKYKKSVSDVSAKVSEMETKVESSFQSKTNDDAISKMEREAKAVSNLIEQSQSKIQNLKPPKGLEKEFDDLKQRAKDIGTAFESASKGLTGEDLTKEIENYKSDLKEISEELRMLQSLGKKGEIVNLDDDTLADYNASISKVRKNLEDTGVEIRNVRISDVTDGLGKFTIQIKDAEGNIKNLSYVYNSEIKKMVQSTTIIGNEGGKFSQFFSALGNKIKDLGTYWIARYLDPADFIQYGQQIIGTIVELDNSIVDLQKTTSMTAPQLQDFYLDTNDAAKEMGVTTKDIIDQASSWSRLGYSDKESATEMAKLSSQFAAISPGMDVDTAQEGLVSVMKAYGTEVDDVSDGIMSKINAVGRALPKHIVICGI